MTAPIRIIAIRYPDSPTWTRSVNKTALPEVDTDMGRAYAFDTEKDQVRGRFSAQGDGMAAAILLPAVMRQRKSCGLAKDITNISRAVKALRPFAAIMIRLAQQCLGCGKHGLDLMRLGLTCQARAAARGQGCQQTG